MATDNLTAQNDPANELTTSDLASNIQEQVHRIASLAEALDDAIDFSVADAADRRSLGRAIDYISMIKEAAAQAQADGERVERLALRGLGK